MMMRNDFPNKGQGAIECCAGSTARSLLAQGATEYIILLGMVLMIALAVVVLLGWSPGASGEQHLSESRLFWQSQTVAIVDGMASDADNTYYIHGRDANDGITVVLLTVQNKGVDPVELIAFKSNYQQYWGDASKAYGAYFPNSPGSNPYSFISPEVMATGTYEAYKAPPKGNNTYTNYSDPTILQPGEKITIGYGIVGSSSTLYGGPENIPMCVEGGISRSFLEYRNFSLYYATTVDGQRAVKREAGPLILPCVPSI